jgi:hypothetical protein
VNSPGVQANRHALSLGEQSASHFACSGLLLSGKKKFIVLGRI